MKNIFKSVKKHKVLFVFLIVILIVGIFFGLRRIMKEEAVVQYITQSLKKGTLISSISGTGQVLALNQIDIKSKVGGDITYINTNNGQEVETGTLILRLDDRDARKGVRDAEANLESARIELEKLKQPPSTLSLLQAENNVFQAQESKQKAEDDLEKAHEDGFNTVSSVFLDLPSIMAGIQDMIYGNDLSGSRQYNINYYADAVKRYDSVILIYKEDAVNDYDQSRTFYNESFISYKGASRYSATSVVEILIEETYETSKLISEAVKSINNLVDFHADVLTQRSIDLKALVSVHQNTLDSYTNTINSHLVSLLVIRRTIQDAEEDIINAGRDIVEKNEFLKELKEGADLLDIQSKELSFKQKENALLDAQEKLGDYSVRVLFGGVIANLDVQKGETISAGNVIGSIITTRRMAEVTFNEIEAVQIEIKQKVVLEFDAIDDLTITGEVIEIDSIGIVSQGVVSYDVKIAFDVQDERIKPGMSVSSSIIIEARQNVLSLPSSAVKSQGGVDYVEVLVNDIPERRIVEIGLSNDTMVEMVSGVTEGDMIITQTISNSDGHTQPANTRNMIRMIR